MFKSLAFAGLLLALLSNQVSAQGPTQAQRDAIRAACRSDFMANCSGVEPGGKEAFECLLRNDAKLSPSCQAAVNAAAPKPAEPAAAAAPAAPAPVAPAQSETAPRATKVERAPPGIQVAPTEAQNEQLKTVQQACTLNDFVAHCSWIAPGNPEVLLCLKANTADLSPNCQAAVQSLPAPTPAATAPPPAEPARQAAPAKKPVEPKPVEPARANAPLAPPTPAAPAAPAAAPAKPTAQQTAAVRATCRSDFMSRCSGVQPGGAEALQCLKRNEAQLSAGCRSAVAAIGGGAGGASVPSGAPAAAAPAVAPIGPMPMLRPREALAIVQICGAEVRSLCAGVPFGGGRIISCLAANASSLSPNCYSALSAAAGR
jgi:hypothetical protein